MPSFQELPYALFKVMFNVVVNRINKVATTKKINALLQPSGAFPASELTDVMEEYLSGLNPAEVGVEKQYFEGLLKICERYSRLEPTRAYLVALGSKTASRATRSSSWTTC